MTSYMWQVTYDMWHLTHDTWQVVNIVQKCQVPSSNGLGFMLFDDFGEKNRSLNQSVDHKDFCRTALATLGLLIMIYIEILF